MRTANYEVYIGFVDKTWDKVAVNINFTDGEAEDEMRHRAEVEAIEKHNASFNIVFATVSHCNFTSN